MALVIKTSNKTSKAVQADIDYVNGLGTVDSKAQLIRMLDKKGWVPARISNTLKEMGIINNYQHVRNTLNQVVKKA